jgi:hypothetical protein
VDDETPKLSLATETEPHELEKAQALRELAWPTREMAANLLRVMRGAGQPAYLPQQLINLSDQILELTKTCRPWAIWSAIEDTLQSPIPDWFDEAEGDAHKGSIAKGALQFLASRLVYQRAQEAAGRREMAEAVREMDRYHERQREKYRQEEARFRVEQQRQKEPWSSCDNDSANCATTNREETALADDREGKTWTTQEPARHHGVKPKPDREPDADPPKPKEPKK